MNLDIGPALRTLGRRPGVLALVVLEIAAGVTTISALLLSGAWYGQRGEVSSGLDEQNLILISTYSPSSPRAAGEETAVDAEQADVARKYADRRRIESVAGVEAVTEVSSSIVEDRWSLPQLFAARATGTTAAAAGRASEAVGWGIYADGKTSNVLGLRYISGAPPKLADRDLTPSRPAAAILTRCLAERLFGKSDSSAPAVGALLSSQLAADVPIAGVVEDVAMLNPFVPHCRCVAFLLGGQPNDREARWIVRVSPGERPALVDRLRAAFAGEATTNRYVNVKAFDSTDGVHHRVGRGLIGLMEFFGGMVGVVALLGALAATSFLVAQRTRQIGIRRALGATKGDIVSYFLVESTLAVAMGSLLGLGGTAALFVVMRRVFQALRFDVGLVVVTLLVMWTASVLATLLPALRAARVPPSVASRSL